MDPWLSSPGQNQYPVGGVGEMACIFPARFHLLSPTPYTGAGALILTW